MRLKLHQLSIRICLQCNYGFDLNKNNICDYVINDSILIPYSGEQCDDGNTIQGDGCYEGKYECSQSCTLCNEVGCLKCQNGFDLTYGQCQPICGDKIVIEKYEQCDDGNNIEYDGCFNCLFQCIKDCDICKNGQCLLKCEQGYELQNDKCVSICGDMIKTQDEECDDGNNEPFDGCFECKISCPLNCKTCLLDLCIECNQFYELDDNQCQPVVNCGNGKIDLNEECDDFNSDPNDGCYNCKIENNFVCFQIDLNSPSECFFQQNVIASLTYLNMTENKQYIELEFSDKIKVSDFKTLSETFNFSILDLAIDKYQIILIPIYEATQQCNYSLYQFEIQINDILTQQPSFVLELGQLVYSELDSAIKQNELIIKLNYPKYLTKAQKQQAQNLLTLNKITIYSLAGFAGLSMLFGILDPLLEIINILSYQQYLRYFNLDFPLNIEIYFSISDLIDITPVLGFMHFEFVMSNLQVPTKFEQSNNDKFLQYQVNSDLISNLQVQLIQIILTIILALIIQQKVTVLKLYQLMKKILSFFAQFTISFTSKIVFKICLGICQAIQMVLALRENITMDGIKQLFYINGWDIIFKAFLYLSSTQNLQTFLIRDYISIVVSSLILLIYVYLMFGNLLQKKNLQKWMKEQLKSKQQEKFFGYQIMRQLSFLFVLVQFQESPILQALLISLISIFYSGVIINYRKIQTAESFYTNIIIEISVTLFTLSSICYSSDFSNYISESKKILYGWLHIILLSLGIQFSMVYQILKGLKYLYGKIKKDQVKKAELDKPKQIMI